MAGRVAIAELRSGVNRGSGDGAADTATQLAATARTALNSGGTLDLTGNSLSQSPMDAPRFALRPVPKSAGIYSERLRLQPNCPSGNRMSVRSGKWLTGMKLTAALDGPYNLE